MHLLNKARAMHCQVRAKRPVNGGSERHFGSLVSYGVSVSEQNASSCAISEYRSEGQALSRLQSVAPNTIRRTSSIRLLS